MTTRAQAAARPRYDELTSQARAELAEGRCQSARLMREFPGWAVMWGSGSREYFAFSLRWDGTAMQRSTEPKELAELMLTAQMAATAPAGRWSPANSPAVLAARIPR